MLQNVDSRDVTVEWHCNTFLQTSHSPQTLFRCVMRGACNVIENVQTGGNIVAAPVKLNIYADQMMIGDGNILQTGDNKTSLLTDDEKKMNTEVAVDIRQIYDKFPEKKGLKELYDKGPQNAFYLVKFWADLNTNVQDEMSPFYGVNSQYESSENMTIQCSTKVCSFGKQVVEKVETEYARFENGRYVYRILRSPMCEYMVNFVHKLKHLPEKYMMNSVLENFTILQVVSNRDNQETLLCIAYVFEVSTSEHGAQHHTYKLVKD
ncbi:hypothetical protein ScPMuIL_013717 [Solemya velum]